MRCSECDNGELQEARRHKSAVRRSRVAVVTDVPVTVCPACETLWFAEDVAVVLDAMLNEMLETDTVAVRQFPATATAAA